MKGDKTMLNLIKIESAQKTMMILEKLKEEFITTYPYYGIWIEKIKDGFSLGIRELYEIQYNEHLVGYILIHYCSNSCVKINGLLIFKEFRGNGYGSKSLSQLIKQLKNNDISYAYIQCRIDNKVMNHLFHKLGFDLIGTNFHPVEKEFNWLGAYDVKQSKNIEKMTMLANDIYDNFTKYSKINTAFNSLMDSLTKQLLNMDKLLFVDALKNPNIGIHLAVCREPYIQYMINGSKTIESRITKNKIVPYGKVKKGDIVILKRSSGPVLAIFTVKNVICYDSTSFSLNTIRNNYQEELQIHDEWWELKRDSRFASLIWIEEIVALNAIDVAIQKNRQSWIIIREG